MVQDVGTRGAEFSRPDSKEICQHDLQLQINILLEASLSRNSKSSYETGLRSFNSFRQAFRYQLLWPPLLFHIVEFIAYLSSKGYTYSTARAYIASISFHRKI